MLSAADDAHPIEPDARSRSIPQVTDTLKPIVTRDLASAAHTVIEYVRQETAYPFLLDTKLGDGNSQPETDKELASAHDIPASTVSYGWTLVMAAIARADGEHGNPLGEIPQRANDFMAAGAIINRHRRLPSFHPTTTSISSSATSPPTWRVHTTRKRRSRSCKPCNTASKNSTCGPSSTSRSSSTA